MSDTLDKALASLRAEADQLNKQFQPLGEKLDVLEDLMQQYLKMKEKENNNGD